MEKSFTYYFEVFDYLYSLSEGELFTSSKLQKEVSCTPGKLRTILNHLCLSQFIYPYANKGYKVNEVKAKFTDQYFRGFQPDFVKFGDKTFEMIFKSSNFFYTLDQKDFDIEKLNNNIRYLLAFMLVFTKNYNLVCKVDIYKNDYGLVFKRIYYLVGTDIQVFSCAIISDGDHLQFGIA